MTRLGTVLRACRSAPLAFARPRRAAPRSACASAAAGSRPGCPRCSTGSSWRCSAVRVTQSGTPPEAGEPALVLSNHVSWLDIIVLGSLRPLSFVAKSEIAGWPVVGDAGAAAAHGVHRPGAAQPTPPTSTPRSAQRLAARRPHRAVRRGHHRRRHPRCCRSAPRWSARRGPRSRASGPDRIRLQPLAITYPRRNGLPVVRGRAARHRLVRRHGTGAPPRRLPRRAVPSTSTWSGAQPIAFEAGTDRKRATALAEASVRAALQRGGHGPAAAGAGLAGRSRTAAPTPDGRHACRSEADSRRRRRTVLGRLQDGRRCCHLESDLLKKAFVKSYGCQMNAYDAARMADVLGAEGYAATDAVEEADVVILNTCHIREKAADKVYSELGRLRVLKGERARGRARDPDRRGGLRRPGRGRRDPGAARPPSTWWSARRTITACRICWPRSATKRVVDTEFPVEDKFDHLPGRAAPTACPPSSPCRRAATSSAPSASCPIPAAPRSRAPWPRSGPRPRSWCAAASARSP